ncbi:MAG TPA: ATP synthase F0 subunit C [Anaerolineae bacterium]|nr:ATP synthase F0 subunit C [Anaerolineae bacterium]HOV48580.1 ATP synthase F0 subunit C [Anaerolineae bacterium]HPD41219.1 ATP synthase F0 subunit C [Anaerolineae bacterium]HRU93670.1 ATP synthase F0 subunit C [Anaerolineae bacterium]HXK42425.1 ATP synthase F0 subunit C [Anaerolineae bacterium]
MGNLSPETLVTLVTILVAGFAIVIGTITPAIVEGKAAVKALEGIVRQPEVSSDLRTTMIIAMALLESTAIYTLLVILILIFANPLLERFFSSGAPESLWLLFTL